jgi:hypothetical protein
LLGLESVLGEVTATACLNFVVPHELVCVLGVHMLDGLGE